MIENADKSHAKLYITQNLKKDNIFFHDRKTT
jgi:hypothetical protein